jgi:hypothetical protein
MCTLNMRSGNSLEAPVLPSAYVGHVGGHVGVVG